MAGNARWTLEQAGAWYSLQPWLVGCNFIPSTAINQIEMWQESTFDEETIHRELAWASAIGLNSVRVYLHDLVWEADPAGFKNRIRRYLAIAEKNSIKTMFVIFDDCWNEKATLGKQPSPIPGVHNSGWVQSPGAFAVVDHAGFLRLKNYVQDIIGSFGNENRILMWDLYNEPGNNSLDEKSVTLLQSAFAWARECSPSQPLTSAIWYSNDAVSAVQLAQSDIITFHNYQDETALRKQIDHLRAHHRPLVCSEYMARTRNSKFSTHLPIFKLENIGCFNWGLVSGKTQTIFPWGSPKGAPEPDEWFHDIFTETGKPYKENETALIRELSAMKS